jgi:hypothetical protein
MAADRTLVVSGINIVTHPHSPQGYVDLLRAATAMRKPVQIRGAQHIMLGELRPLDRGNPTDGLFGRVYRFDHIDPELPWFNLERHQEATEDEMSAIAIPKDLVPNLVLFDFVFYPKGHVLYFVSKRDRYSLSPRSLYKLLEVLFETRLIFGRFGKVDLTIMPDRQTLARIMKLHRLAKLTIDVTRPNPDDNFDDDEEVFDRMRNQGARRVMQVMTAENGESIKPDHETAQLARVAARNGKVSAVGYKANGQKVEETTVDSPWRETVAYDPDHQLAPDVLIAFSAQHLVDAL